MVVVCIRKNLHVFIVIVCICEKLEMTKYRKTLGFTDR